VVNLGVVMPFLLKSQEKRGAKVHFLKVRRNSPVQNKSKFWRNKGKLSDWSSCSRLHFSNCCRFDKSRFSLQCLNLSIYFEKLTYTSYTNYHPSVLPCVPIVYFDLKTLCHIIIITTTTATCFLANSSTVTYIPLQAHPRPRVIYMSVKVNAGE